MLQHKKIAVIGGDQRYVHMIEYLANERADIFAVGFTDVSFNNRSVQKHTIDTIPFQTMDTVILPVHGMDETSAVDQYFPPGKITLTKEMLAKTPANSVIFSGTANEQLRQLCQAINRKLIVHYELDHVAILNALPTAEATLQLAMQHTARTINGQNVLITGFGRVAQAIAQLFKAVGANVRIVARSQSDRATANIRGMEYATFNQLSDIVKTANICINTVPHLVFTEQIINNMHRDTLLVDVASTPGGTDFSAAETFGIKTIHALGLPGKTVPQTAGEIIAQPVIEALLS